MMGPSLVPNCDKSMRRCLSEVARVKGVENDACTMSLAGSTEFGFWYSELLR